MAGKKTAANSIQNAKVDSLLSPDLCFFGALMVNLRYMEDSTQETAWTDGTTLGYNPEFIEGLTHSEVIGVLAHEAMHCAGSHPYRRDNRDMEKWNIACDYAINGILEDCGITLPEGSLVTPPQFKGKSAEYIYDRLPDTPPQQKNGKGKGQGKPIPGSVRDAPSPKSDNDEDGSGQAPSDNMSEGDWQEANRQAAGQAKARGKMPAGLERYSKDAIQAKIDWKSVLRRFVTQQMTKDDYTWKRPSSRYIATGLYLPSLHSESAPRMAVAIDTSGSIDAVALAQAKAELQAIVDEVRPAFVDVFYADAAVARHDTFERDEPIIFSPAGGGGTDFRPVFDAIANMEEQPACLIYVTDLYGTFPEPTDLPVLWACDNEQVAPFGETVKIA